jgi:hypothetical protein
MKEEKMGNRVRVGVMLTHYVVGSGNQYTSDLTSMELLEKTLKDKTLLEIAINDYCEDFASLMVPYDTNSEEYILSFWLDDDRKIKSVLLSDYAHLFGQGLDDVEMAD